MSGLLRQFANWWQVRERAAVPPAPTCRDDHPQDISCVYS